MSNYIPTFHRVKMLPPKSQRYTVNVKFDRGYNQSYETESFAFDSIQEVVDFYVELHDQDSWSAFSRNQFGETTTLIEFEVFEFAADGVYELSDSKHTENIGPPLT